MPTRRDTMKVAALNGLAICAGSMAVLSTAAQAQAQGVAAPMWNKVPMPAQAPQSDGQVDVGGGMHLWYWDTGGPGVPVIFLHSGTGSAAGWGYQQPVFAAAGWRAVGYSRRGYFRSDGGDPATMPLAADDLEALIGRLGADKVHLVAAAQGGYVAIDYTLLHPERVASLTILSSLMGVVDADYAEVNARLRPKFFATLPASFQELSATYRAGNAEGFQLWEKLTGEAVNGKRIDPKLSRPLTWALLESIRIPVLLMTGDSDLYVPPSLLRMQARHLPQAETVVIKEAGHAANWEQPETFNRLTLDFIRRHSH